MLSKPTAMIKSAVLTPGDFAADGITVTFGDQCDVRSHFVLISKMHFIHCVGDRFRRRSGF